MSQRPNPQKFDPAPLNQGLFFDQNYLNKLQNPYGGFENPSDAFNTNQSTILKGDNSMKSQQSLYPSFTSPFDRPIPTLTSQQGFQMGSKPQPTQVTQDGNWMQSNSYQPPYKPTPQTLLGRTVSQEEDEQLFRDVNALTGSEPVYLDPQKFFGGGFKHPDSESSFQRWPQINFAKNPEFEVRREGDPRRPQQESHFLSNPAQPQSHDDDEEEEAGYGRERLSSKNSISIEDKLNAISRSVHGATKYLNEILAKSKKNLNIHFDETIVNKQPNFHCILSVDHYQAKKSGKSKQEAKNAAALELIKKMIEKDQMADSYLMKILHSDKSIHITRAMETKKDKFIAPTIQDKQKLLKTSGSDDEESKGASIDNPQIRKTSAPVRLSDSLHSGLSLERMEVKASEATDFLSEIEKYARNNGLKCRFDDSKFVYGILFLYIGDKQYQGSGSDLTEAMVDAARNAYNFLIGSKKPFATPNQQLTSLPTQAVSKPKISSPLESPNTSIFSGTPSKHSVSWNKRDVVEKFMASPFFVDLQDQLKYLDQKLRANAFEVHLQDMYEKSVALLKADSESLERFSLQFIKLIEESLQPAFILKNREKMHENLAKVIKSVNSFFFVPIGSFALKQTRNNNKCADFVLMYELSNDQIDVSKITEKVLLNTLKFVLDIQNVKSSVEAVESKFDHKQNFLLTQEDKTGNMVRLYIYSMQTPSFKTSIPSVFVKYEPSIVHVATIDRILKNNEENREYFNKLCSLVKWWRQKSGLTAHLPAEILDIICLHISISYEANSISSGVLQALNLLLDTENALSILARYSEYHKELYEKLGNNEHSSVARICKHSISYIAEEKFPKAYF